MKDLSNKVFKFISILFIIALIVLTSFSFFSDGQYDLFKKDVSDEEVYPELKKGNASLIDRNVFLYDKNRQLGIIKNLYGDDLSTPSSYDLRNYIDINAKESQGNLGICGVFSVIKAIETNISLVEHKNYNFSERYIDYMTSKAFYGERNIGSLGYNGDMGDYISYQDIIDFINKYGLVLENDVPYRNYNEYEYDLIRNAKGVRTIKQYVTFSNYNFETDKYYWMDILKKHITRYGGVVSLVHFNEDLYNKVNFSFYNNGDAKNYDDKESNHAVVIVGWDDSYSRDNFLVKPSRDGAFIVYTSWGENFGDRGYFYVSYEDADILSYLFSFISTTSYYEKGQYLDDVEIPEFDNLLFEEKTPNEYGGVSSWYYAYVFDKNSDYSKISEISYYSHFDSSIEIYINPYDGDIDTFSKFNYIGSISFDNFGYKNYLFDEPFNVYGDRFAVILKYETRDFKLFAYNMENNNNVYVYKDNGWDKASMVPYFNVYGYKF